MFKPINKSIAALLMGVFVIAMIGCESKLPVEALEEQEKPTLMDQMSQSFEGDLTLEERQNLEPGPISPPVLTGQIREVLKNLGRDPDSIMYGGLSDKGIWLVGEEAWEKFMKDRRPGPDSIRRDGPVTFEPVATGRTEVVIPLEFALPVFGIQSGSATPASTEFTITEISNPPASGSVTVRYEGIRVTSNYTSSDNAMAVAWIISSNINNDANIQLTASVSGSTVRVTEKRSGCAYNGNVVYVSHTNGTHITVNNDTFYMSGGTDDGVGCNPPAPPPAPILKSPANGASNQPADNLLLEWYPADRADTYRLQVATDAGFSGVVLDKSGITSTSGYVSGLNYSTTYYWRVNASNTGGTSGWSDAWSFTTSAPPLNIAYGSSVDTPCCDDFGYVDLSSFSWASEPIPYLDVYGWSYRDYALLANLYDGGQWRSYAAVGISEFKSAFDPVSFWEQLGDHYFEDPRIYPNGKLNPTSEDWANF